MKTLEDPYCRQDQFDSYDQPQRDTSPGTPSNFYHKFRQLVRNAAKRGISELPAVLYVRVSSSKQKRNANADHQLAYVRRRVRRIGQQHGVAIIVVKAYSEDASGWNLWASGRPVLVKAAKQARKRGAVLVALNTSRLVRNRHHARNVLPTVDDFERLMGLVGNIQVATIFHPDHQEDRGADTIRGHKARKARPGRPTKKQSGNTKRYKVENFARVIVGRWLGVSFREMESEIGVNYRTAARWWREWLNLL